MARAKAELQSGHRNIRAHQAPALQRALATHCLFLNAHNPGVSSVMLTGQRRSQSGGSGGLPEGWQAQRDGRPSCPLFRERCCPGAPRMRVGADRAEAAWEESTSQMKTPG